MTDEVIKDRFLVTDFTIGCDRYGIVFTCRTDNDCRLKLYLCAAKPVFKTWKHKKRGIVQTHDRYYFPNVFMTYWQDEPGDTWFHTFHITGIAWDHEWYWFMLAWRKNIELFSISQIFHHSCPPYPYPELKHDGDYPSATAVICYSDRLYGVRFTPPQDMKLYSLSVAVCIHLLDEEQCRQATLLLLDNPVCEAPEKNTIATSSRTLPTLATCFIKNWIEFDFDLIPLEFSKVYGWLLQGCAPFPDEPHVRLLTSPAPGDGVSLHAIRWYDEAPWDYIECDVSTSHPFKLKGAIE